jgi:hypothetical protein
VATDRGEQTSVGHWAEGGGSAGEGPAQTGGWREETHREQGGEVAGEGPTRVEGSTSELHVISF